VTPGGIRSIERSNKKNCGPISSDIQYRGESTYQLQQPLIGWRCVPLVNLHHNDGLALLCIPKQQLSARPGILRIPAHQI
jgi:hypothetical protein